MAVLESADVNCRPQISETALIGSGVFGLLSFTLLVLFFYLLHFLHFNPLQLTQNII
jgi:hypothetical protein